MVVKYCSALCCKNNSLHNKNKIFIRIPTPQDIKVKWFKAINQSKILKGNHGHVCEDHFNLEEDAENWMEFKILGTKLRIKKDVLPHLNLSSNEGNTLKSQITPAEKKRKMENQLALKALKSKKKLNFDFEEANTSQTMPITFTEVNIKEASTSQSIQDTSFTEVQVSDPLLTGVEIRDPDLKHNSTSRNQEYTNLEVSLIDIKHTHTEIALLENTLNTEKTKLLSDMKETCENNKDECEIKSNKVITNNTDLMNKNFETSNILNNKIKTEKINDNINYNTDYEYVGNGIKKTNTVTESKLEESMNQNIEYDASIDRQYDIMYFKESRNIKNVVRNDYTNFELSTLETCNATTLNETDYATKNNIKTDLGDEVNIIHYDFQTLNSLIIKDESLDEITEDDNNETILPSEDNSDSLESRDNFDNIKKENIDFHDDCSSLYNSEILKNQIKSEETTINKNDVFKIDLDFENEAKNNIKAKIDTYLHSLIPVLLVEEESLDIPFDIKDEIMETTSEGRLENILISEDNSCTIKTSNVKLTRNDFENNNEGTFDTNNSDKNTNLQLSEALEIHNKSENNNKMVSKTQDINKLHSCSTCNKRFASIQHLKHHIDAIHSDNRYKFICDICKKRFVSKSHLKRHMDTIHSDNRYKFTCDICNKKFCRSDQFKNHGKIHDKPYSCTICHKQFIYSFHLNDHLKTHSGEKPFKCEVCLKTFSQKSNYTTHFRIHSGEKPYSCSFCEKRFFGSNDMLRHQRIHTQDFKHKCSVCDKKFNENSKLKRHLKVHEKKNNQFMRQE